MTGPERNWAGNVTFTPQTVVTPTTVDQLRHDVATAAAAGRRVRAAGARHTFSPIGATDGTLVVMDELSAIVGIDREAGTVMVEAGVRYADLAPALHDEGLALHNLASLPHLSVGGAVATSTHGSGVGNQSLAGAVMAIDVVTSSGDIERIDRGTDLGAAAIAGLGAFGVVARVSLRVEPTFDVAQDVFVDLPFDAGVEHLDEIMGSAYSVSLFTNWRSDVFDQVWQKRRHVDLAGGRTPTSGASVPSRRWSRCIRSWAWRRRRAPSRAAGRGRGTVDSPTFALTPCRASVPNCRPSTSWLAPTPATRCGPCTSCAGSSSTSCWSPRSGRWRPTTSG